MVSLGLNLNNAGQRKEGQNKEGIAAGLRVHYVVSPARRVAYRPPIHLPNFGQFNKLQEKLLWHC